MQHKHCFSAVDRLLVDLRSVTSLFGGVPVILGGDWAQTLPVVRHGDRSQTVLACLQRSRFWPKIERLHLRINMRVRTGGEGSVNKDFLD